MLINGQAVTAKSFAFDGCHKIYLCESSNDEQDAIGCGYNIYPISQLKDKFNDSCSLRFIYNWSLDKTFVPQFEDAVFNN